MSSRKRSSKGIEDAVTFFVKAKTRQKFKGNEELLSSLDVIEQTSLSTGLSEQHISSLVNVAASGVQVESVSKRIIKALIPFSTVPEDAVLKVISWLCTRKPSIKLQCLLVRWIIVIYDFIDKRDSLHAVYGVLFHFLHYRTLMPHVAHLLYLLTRKEDVKLFRVRFLMQYQKDMGAQPFLTGLLTIYRHYYPNLIHLNSRSYKSFFPIYDRKWSALVGQVRERNNLCPYVDITWEQALIERLYPVDKAIDLVPSGKRRKINPIPIIHSLINNSDSKTDTFAQTLGIQKVPFILIHSFKQILDNIECIEFPSQIGAVLRSETLQHVMSYSRDPIVSARFQFWISNTFQEELIDTLKDKHKDMVLDLLKLLQQFCEFMQEGIPSVDLLLHRYLQTWNGVDYVPFILKLLSRYRLKSFEVLSRAILEPLRKLFFMSSVYFKCKIVICLTELLRNHAANEWPRKLDLQTAPDSCFSMFTDDSTSVSGLEDIVKYIQFVSRMILVTLVADKHALFELCALIFLDMVSSLHINYNLPFVVLVEPRLIERLVISNNPFTVSQICSILCRYKENFFSLRNFQRSGVIATFNKSEEMKMIRCFNQLIIAITNALWRFKAHSNDDKHSILNFNPVLIDPDLANSRIEEGLSLFRHHALLPFTCSYVFKVLMEPAIDVQELMPMKREFLKHLDTYNLTGISQFISSFIRSISSLGSSQ